MNPTGTAIMLIVSHFVGDWFLQGRTIAENKSKSVPILCAHVCIIGVVMCAAFLLTGYPHTQATGIKLLMYLILHGLQDRYIWRYYEHTFHDPANPDRKGKPFYTTIAIDQMIHLSLLMYFFL